MFIVVALQSDHIIPIDLSIFKVANPAYINYCHMVYFIFCIFEKNITLPKSGLSLEVFKRKRRNKLAFQMISSDLIH